MRRLTFRMAIALLTFVVSLAAVSAWLFFQRASQEKRVEPAAYAQTLTLDLDTDRLAHLYVPAVKAIYLSEPLDSCGPPWVFGEIVVFYEGGEWGKVAACMVPVGKKLQIQWAYGYHLQAGRWSEDQGQLTVSIEGQYFSCMSEWPKKAISYPIIENWRFRNGDKASNILIASKRRFKKISLDKFTDINDSGNVHGLLEAPLEEVEKYKTTLCK